MKLYFRLLLLWLRLKRSNRITPEKSVTLTSRVWPTDLDFNGHMTNTRYASFFDLSHIQLFSQLGLIPTLKKNDWSPIINARTISYFKELSPFESFDITSRLIYWDRSYFYLEQRAVNQQGKTAAICYSRGLIIQKKTKSSKLVPLKDVLRESTGIRLSSPEIPTHIDHWKDTLMIQKQTAKQSIN